MHSRLTAATLGVSARGALVAARGVELDCGGSASLAPTRKSVPGEAETERSVLLPPAFLLSTVGTGKPIPVTVNDTATVPTLVAIDKVP
jgi:hypothetical protein